MNPKTENKEQIVVCAACKSSKGTIVAGARHCDSVMRPIMFPDHKRTGEWSDFIQGFIDQHGTFLTREEAYVIAKKNNQIRHPEIGENVLYSEHLY